MTSICVLLVDGPAEGQKFILPDDRYTVEISDGFDKGVIHPDLERGFSRAQTIAFDDFIAYKGEHGAKEAGKMRAEGKEYVVKDGDVLNFLFNV